MRSQPIGGRAGLPVNPPGSGDRRVMRAEACDVSIVLESSQWREKLQEYRLLPSRMVFKSEINYISVSKTNIGLLCETQPKNQKNIREKPYNSSSHQQLVMVVVTVIFMDFNDTGN